MKHKFFYYLLIISISPLYLFSQEIRNGSFEENENTLPTHFTHFTLIDDWDNDAFDDNAHSPDWFKACHEDAVKIAETPQLFPPEDFTIIEANTGCGYAGMLRNELIEQNIGNVEPNITYKITLSLRLLQFYKAVTGLGNNIASIPARPVNPNYNLGPIYLRTILATNKITYEEEGNDFEANDLKEIDRILINPSLFPMGQWHTDEFFFSVNSEFDYKWIAFEVVGANPYILLDDISIEKSSCEACETECDPYSGCIDFTIGNVHGIDNPQTLEMVRWGLSNLGNVKHLKAKIFTVSGQLVRQINYYYVGDTFLFDGKDDIGNELPEGNYTYQVTLENNCQTVETEGMFTKANPADIPTLATGTAIKQSPLFPPSCCQDVILINNFDIESGENLILDGNFQVEAGVLIVVGPGVTISEESNITFQAGVECILSPSPQVDIEAGANVNCVIDDCNIPNLDDDDENIRTLQSELIDRNNVEELEFLEAERFETPKDFRLYPSPSKGIFYIEYSNEQREEFIVEVLDNNGNLIYNTKSHLQSLEINIKGYPKGVYFVLLKSQNSFFGEKIIIY